MADSQESLLLQIKEQGELVRKLKAAKEANEKGKKDNGSLNIMEMDHHLSLYSYLCGYMPSKCDIETSKQLKNVDIKEYKYIKRWLDHMGSFSEKEILLFPVTLPKFSIKLENSRNFDEQVPN